MMKVEPTEVAERTSGSSRKMEMLLPEMGRLQEGQVRTVKSAGWVWLSSGEDVSQTALMEMLSRAVGV